MTRNKKYDLIFAPEALGHLDAIERKYYGLIEHALDAQLSFEPERQTHNRKPLEAPAPFHAAWELRFGPSNRFRVFYEIDQVARVVHVLAIGLKDRNRLFFAGKEFEL